MGGSSSKKQEKLLEQAQEKYARSSSNDVGVLQSLEQYERHAILGEGTFGRVVLYNINGVPVAVKALKKRPMIDLKQLKHVQDEINILKMAEYPFIVRYYSGFQDKNSVYLLLEYIQGGEMFSYLRDEGKFNINRTRLYSGEILLALRFLHMQRIVYRDLKPENLLVRGDGHVIITDFGFAKKLSTESPRTFTTCGTPDYLAPEIIRASGHREYVDLWALGVLIFEMATGYPPFYTEGSDLEMYKKIIRGERNAFPKTLSKNKPFVSIVNGLLTVDISKRLGCGRKAANAILSHKFYQSLKWHQVFERNVKPEFVPNVGLKGGAFDTSRFDEYEPDNSEPEALTEEEVLKFKVFDDVF
jgi:serine/threonine protein kinase